MSPLTLTPVQKTHLGIYGLAWLMGVLGVLVTTFALDLADRQGMGPDHWLLWTIRGCTAAATILTVVLVLFRDRLSRGCAKD